MTTQSQADRLRKEIATLQKSDAVEAKKEAREIATHHKALQGAARAGSNSTRDAKVREADRSNIRLANIRKKRADLAVKVANKKSSLSRYS